RRSSSNVGITRQEWAGYAGPHSSEKEFKKCGKSLHCNVVSARTGITPPRRTRKSTPNAWRLRNSAARAASTRRTKRSSDDPIRVVILSDGALVLARRVEGSQAKSSGGPVL